MLKTGNLNFEELYEDIHRSVADSVDPCNHCVNQNIHLSEFIST